MLPSVCDGSKQDQRCRTQKVVMSGPFALLSRTCRTSGLDESIDQAPKQVPATSMCCLQCKWDRLRVTLCPGSLEAFSGSGVVMIQYNQYCARLVR